VLCSHDDDDDDDDDDRLLYIHVKYNAEFSEFSLRSRRLILRTTVIALGIIMSL